MLRLCKLLIPKPAEAGAAIIPSSRAAQIITQSMGWRTCWLILILKLMLIARATAAALPCLPVVWASDGGKWFVGGQGRVFCTCDSSHVADLHFLLGGKRLPPDSSPINSTTVAYTMSNATETVQNEFECWAQEAPLASVKVTVFAVLHVEDLACRFHGEEQLNCSFSRPEGKDFWNVTSYRLEASTALPDTSRCAPEPDNPARMQCVMQMTGYAKKLDTQSFTLTMISGLDDGTQTQEIELPSVEMKVPAWPADTVNQTVNDTLRCLAWTNEQNLVNEKLEWRVELRPRRPGIPAQNFTMPGREKTHHRTLTLCFPEPPQANQIFDVRLKLRFNETGAIWSEYYPEFEFTTNATVPARPPQFLADGFSYKELEGSRELTVFWFQLDELEHNGPNLTYAALWDGRQEANRYGSSFATFTNWDPTKPGNVSVRSRNSVGFSVNSSWLLVPAMSEVAKRQSTILEYNPAAFRLAWDKPEESSLLTGYNVYWCNASDILGQFCKDGAPIHHISLDDGDRPEYTFPSSMALMDMAVSANYSDHVSGGLNLRLVGDEAKLREQAFQFRLARVLEGIGALLVLGLVAMSVQKLRKMADFKVELPEMGYPAEQPPPKPEPSAHLEESAVIGVTEGSVSFFYRANDRVDIELTTFASNGGGTISEAEQEEELVAEPAPKSAPYVRMDNGNPVGYVMPPPPRVNAPSNGYVMPPPSRLIPNNDGYINPPPPRLSPNNDGYVMPPPPRLIPNNDGHINPPPPRLSPNNDGYVLPPPPRFNAPSNGYVMPPPPRFNAPSNGYVMPPPPRLIPNNDGYINPPPPPLNPNNDGYVMPPPPRLNPNNDGFVSPPPPR